MKKLFLLMLLLVTVGSVFAQADMSVYYKRAYEDDTFIPWFTYTMKDKVMFDLRYNFDVLKSGGAFVGKSFGNGTISITPEVGFIFGDYNSFSPEFYLSYNKGRFSSFSLWQYSWGFGGHGYTNKEGITTGTRHFDYTYQWSDNQISITKWLSIGIDEQLYREQSHGTWFDFGPAAKLSFGKLYVKPWLSFSAGANDPDITKFYLGIGYVKE